MIEESVVAAIARRLRPLRRGAEKAQRGQYAGARLGTGDVAALDSDPVGRETEADRGNTRERGCRVAIEDEAAIRVREFPEIVEGAPLDVVEQGIDGRRSDDGLRLSTRAAGRTGNEQRQYRKGTESRELHFPITTVSRCCPAVRGSARRTAPSSSASGWPSICARTIRSAQPSGFAIEISICVLSSRA